MRRKVLITAVAVAVLVVVAALALPAIIDINRYRPQIESRLEEQLDRDVGLGSMRLGLFPPSFHVENAVIGDDPEFPTGRPFAEVETLSVRPRLLPLLGGDIEIDNLRLVRPRLELVRNREGVWNFVSLLEEPEAAAPGEPREETVFSLDRLEIEDGQVAITDLREDGPRAVYDHIDLVLRDFAPEQAFSLEARAHMPGADRGVIALEGEAGPLPEDGLARTPFEGTLELDAVSLSALESFLQVEALAGSEAVLTGNAAVRNDEGMFSSGGSIGAREILARGVDLGYPVTIDYEMTGDLNAPAFEIQRADLNLGGTPISLEGRIDARPDPAIINMRLRADDASISELARLASAFGIAFSTGTDAAGELELDVHAQGPLNRPALDGQIAARAVRVTGENLRDPVEIDSIDISLSPEAIRSSEFTARTGGTSLAAQFVLSRYTSDTPFLEARARTGDASLRELLQIAGAHGISALEQIEGSGIANLDVAISGPITPAGGLTYSIEGQLREVDANPLLSSISSVDETLYGTLSAVADARFTAAGGDPASIARSLNGQVHINLEDGRIANMDLLQQLATIAQFQTAAGAAEPFTELIQLTGDFDIEDGVARTDNLEAVIDAGSVAAEGTVNLVDRGLNLRLTAVLSEDYSQRVGGTNIGGFLTTALANSERELVIPVILTGTFEQPRFAPDIEAVARMKVQQLLPSTSEPGEVTTGILERVLGPRQEQAEEPPGPGAEPRDSEDEAAEPAETFRDLLEGVFGGGEDAEQPEDGR